MNKEKLFTIKDVENIFQLKDKINSRQTVFNMEERGEIPKARRVPQGKIEKRVWSLQDMCFIGEKLSYLKKPKSQKRIVFSISKGGNQKTFQTYTLARMLALSGIKTLVIPLDIQKSFTKLVSQDGEIDDISQIKDEELGLYHLLFEGASKEEVIKQTDLPFLDYIPETSELNILEKRLRLENRKEYVINDRLIKNLTEYSVLLFDVAPSFSSLIENALVCSTDVISPIACEVGTYQILDDYIEMTEEFFNVMGIQPNQYFLPVFLDKSKISQQIYGSYLQNYSEKIIPIGLKRTVVAQEASVMKESIFEYDPTSSLAIDQSEAFKQLWERILKSEGSK